MKPQRKSFPFTPETANKHQIPQNQDDCSPQKMKAQTENTNPIMSSISADGQENNSDFDIYKEILRLSSKDVKTNPQPQKNDDFIEGSEFFKSIKPAPLSQNLARKSYVDFFETWPLEDLYAEHNDHSYFVLEDKYQILTWAVSVLLASPSARKMIDEATDQGWSLGLEPLGGHDFHLDVPEKQIILDTHGLLIAALGRSEYFCNCILISLTRGLRDIWQEKRYGAFDEIYTAESVLTLERVRAADLDVLAILIAWELRSAGFGGLWRHIIGSADGDMALVYAQYLERTPGAIHSGKALQLCFAQWFAEPARIQSCDHETLNMLDDILLQRQGIEPVFGAQKATPIAIEKLSCLPDKTAYLQGFGPEILADPKYAGLGDPVNQSHFVQIMHDSKAVRVHDVPFRSAALAAKIFPNGQFTSEGEER